MICSAALIPVLGSLPGLTLGKLAERCLSFVRLGALEGIRFFSPENLKGGAITLVIGTLVYLLIVRKWMYSPEKGYLDRWPARLDIEDRLYRPLFCRLIPLCMVKAFDLLSCTGDAAAHAFTALLKSLSAALEKCGDLAAHGFTWLLAFLSRMLEGITDFVALLIHETAFVNHRADRRGEVGGEAAHIRQRATELQRRVDRLKPELRPDPREVTDLRYGSYFTNTITFGLIVATAGIVAALLYILIKHG